MKQPESQSRIDIIPKSSDIMLSRELLNSPLNWGDYLYDKVFALAENISQMPDGSWRVEIGNAPIVVLNENIRHENPRFINCPTINEVRNREVPYYLFSGGAIIIDTQPDGVERFAVLQRDTKAPSDPNKWTTPAGRCGEYPSTSSIRESLEELIIISNGSVLAFYGHGVSKEEAIAYKLHQLQERLNLYQDKIVIKPVIFNLTTPQHSTQRIITTIDNNIVDEIYGLAFMDKDNNTLETRGVIHIKISNNSLLQDGESFDRKAALMSEDELMIPTNECVFALRKYLMSKKNKLTSKY